MQIRCDGCFEIYDDKYEVCPHCGHFHGAKPKEPFALEIGTVLEDRYIIGNEVGLGGFGITYKAWDQVLETAVAIKEYYPSSMVNRVPGTSEVIRFESKYKAFQFGLERLIMEAQYMAQFNTHDNIVHVLSYFEANNTAYIVMEFLEGCTLGEYVREHGLMTWEESVKIVLQICEALNVIHKVGIIHRDISPDNIFMCDNGAVKLIDFGAARFSQNMESNYTVILKPGFAPPEQYTKISTQGPWTDVYAVGATLYYLSTGQKPEESTNRKTNDTLQEPIKLNPELPQYLSDAIMKAMAIEPHLRFSSIDEFVAVIKKEKKVVSLKTEKKRRILKRFIGIAALLAVLALFVGAVVKDVYDDRDKLVLQDAAIEMWYVENDENTLDKVYGGIVQEFCKNYSNVMIRTKGFGSQAELQAALQTGTPSLVQVDAAQTNSVRGALDLTDVASPERTGVIELVSSVFKRNGGSDCLFLNDFSEYFPDRACVPTGFSMPVLYVNTSMEPFEADEIDDMSELDDYVKAGDVLLIDEDLAAVYADLFAADAQNSAVYGSVEDFIAGDAAFFLGDTSDYFAVRTMTSKMTGVPKVVAIRTDRLACRWEILWSVVERSKAQDAAARRFLEYLLSEAAQSALFNSSDGGCALPLNKKELDRFCDLYDELSFVPSLTKHCVFGEVR